MRVIAHYDIEVVKLSKRLMLWLRRCDFKWGWWCWYWWHGDV